MLNRGNCPAAVGAMRALLASTGPVAEYQSILGFCARIAGDYDLAWRSYRPGFEEGLVNDENAFGFGVAALRTGRLEDAERGFLRAAELYPQAAGKARTALALVRLRRALVLVRTSPAAAAATLERAIAGAAAAPRPPDLESLVPLLHAALAVARLAQGRPADAIAERDLAASALPDIRRLTGEEIHAELEGFAREMTTRIGPPGEP
jgi:tetratricopeptide (TPR) repeat protein